MRQIQRFRIPEGGALEIHEAPFVPGARVEVFPDPTEPATVALLTEVDPNLNRSRRAFQTFANGGPLPDDARWVGTYQKWGTIWIVVELVR